jgi:hypothetical protein
MRRRSLVQICTHNLAPRRSTGRRRPQRRRPQQRGKMQRRSRRRNRSNSRMDFGRGRHEPTLNAPAAPTVTLPSQQLIQSRRHQQLRANTQHTSTGIGRVRYKRQMIKESPLNLSRLRPAVQLLTSTINGEPYRRPKQSSSAKANVSSPSSVFAIRTDATKPSLRDGQKVVTLPTVRFPSWSRFEGPPVYWRLVSGFPTLTVVSGLVLSA